MKREVAIDLAMVVLAVVSVVLILVEFLVVLSPGDLVLLYAVDLAIVGVFAAEFYTKVRREERKGAYARRHWYELVGMLPSVLFAALENEAFLGVVARGFRLLRVARILRLVGAAGRMMRFSHYLKNFVRRAHLIPFALVVAMVVFLSGVAAWEFEKEAPEGNIKTMADGLWWAAATVTTVGYGDRYPVTPPGRMVGVFTMVAGITLFGTLIALMGVVLAQRLTGVDPDLEAIQKRLGDAPNLTDAEARSLVERVEAYLAKARKKS
ncbi:MAG: potassium channel family protein [Euryarchaeota archaeon]|nr:potassium channel family protein [Euryarchaeota archaeon]